MTTHPLFRALPALLLFGVPNSWAGTWDPDDDTFDPAVASVVAEGGTRLGDPAPFLRDGSEETGFTHVTIQEDPVREMALISISLLHPDPTEGGMGGFLFLEADEAERLAQALRSRASRIEAGEGPSGNGPVTLPGLSGPDEWAVLAEGEAKFLFEGPDLTLEGFLDRDGDGEATESDEFDAQPGEGLDPETLLGRRGVVRPGATSETRIMLPVGVPTEVVGGAITIEEYTPGSGSAVGDWSGSVSLNTADGEKRGAYGITAKSVSTGREADEEGAGEEAIRP